MGIEQELSDTLTRAIKDKDAPTANVVRMLKTKLQERRTAKGFSGTVDDALLVEIAGAERSAHVGAQVVDREVAAVPVEYGDEPLADLERAAFAFGNVADFGDRYKVVAW